MATSFVSVKLQGIDQLRGNIERLRRDFPQAAAQVMRTSAIAVLIPAIRDNIKKNRSVFTGEYFNRMDAVSGIENGKPFVEVGAIGVPYGLNVEKGAPPHTPNIARIKEYVRKKLGFSGVQADTVATNIFRTIEFSGSKAKPNIMPAWQANSGRFYADFVRRMRAGGFFTKGSP